MNGKETHHAENFDQVDSRGVFSSFVDEVSQIWAMHLQLIIRQRFIRYGLMSRDEAIQIVKECDGELDPLCVRDFCEFCGYSENGVFGLWWNRFYNRELFVKNEYGKWVLKTPIWKESRL